MLAARLLKGLVAVAGIAWAASQLGASQVLLDNLSNFPPMFAAGFALGALALAALGERRWAAAAALTAALVIAPVVPWYLPREARADEPGAPGIKLLVSNVYFRNYQHKELIRLVHEERPDMIGLVEVTSHWLRKLDALHAEYPYRVAVPDEVYAGVALFSRWPLSDARVLVLGDTHLPAVAATLQAPGGPVEVVVVHPSSPVSQENFELRNRQLRALADYARTAARPLVVAGDFNVTMWNRHYQPLADVGGLHNAREGHGVDATWPAGWPLGVPIDHVLASDDVQLRNFRVLRAIGSDHRPIAAEFAAR
jgi:endonuclease/exonuclease/phosphatase (EEP) superfamily protein YafD